MACADLHTGSAFLSTTLAHLDCQARNLGAYGYGALADPASGTIALLTALLTIFIALFGIRLMLGAAIDGRDVVGDVLKVGIVLTLATSWPAFRVLAYDTVLEGPSGIAKSIDRASGLPAGGQELVARLQNADDGLVALTAYGTGRLTGGVLGSSDLGDSFHGIALADQTGFGWGRVSFLVGVIGPYAITRIGAGLLLALAPIMAGLLLFSGTVPVFWGWIRGLGFVALASLALSIAAGVELSLLTPWLADVLAVRASGVFTPSAPTELMVLASALGFMNLGLVALCGRVAFLPHASVTQMLAAMGDDKAGTVSQANMANGNTSGTSLTHGTEAPHSRAQAIADAVAGSLRREEAGGMAALHRTSAIMSDQRQIAPHDMTGYPRGHDEALGSSFRRSSHRSSQAGTRRDRQA